MTFDVEAVRQDFPLLHQLQRGKRLAFLDSAASSLRPRPVLDAMRAYEETSHANVHRGVYLLSQKATDAYEGARRRVGAWLGAGDAYDVIFTRGTTEAVNLVAHSFGALLNLQAGDEILLTHMEHHANIVPWQMLAERTGARIVVAPITQQGELDLDGFGALLGPKTKLAALVHVSNTLGTVNPARDIVALCRAKGVPVLLDGAQAVHHLRVNVQDLDCDFYAFSGHKMYAPTGIGVLLAKQEHARRMPPWQGGGDMILSVSFEGTRYAESPHRFEAGTPNIVGAVGLAAAIDYLEAVDFDGSLRYEHELLGYATQRLSALPGVRLVGTAPHKVGVLSFVMDGVHPHDIGTILDREGVAVRTGHHCTQPLMRRLDIAATARASLGVYSVREDIDQLVHGLGRVREVFA